MDRNWEALVDDMLEREAIRDLAHRYCQHLWLSHADAYVELFTEDGVFSRGPGFPEIRGRDAMRQHIQAVMIDFMPRPFVHNHVIDLLGDGRATGWCCVEVRRGSRNMEWHESSYYDDVYEKVDAKWKFKSRTLRRPR